MEVLEQERRDDFCYLSFIFVTSGMRRYKLVVRCVTLEWCGDNGLIGPAEPARVRTTQADGHSSVSINSEQ